MKYDAWPLGKDWAERWKRPELEEIKKRGYTWNNPREIVELFENRIADFTGAPFAVAVDNCTDALLLTLGIFVEDMRSHGKFVCIPGRTYISVPMAALQIGMPFRFTDLKWGGQYKFSGIPVFDAAMAFKENMYIEGSLMCLSFQYKKRIPIGKGGMILLDKESVAVGLRVRSFEGRNIDIPYDKDEPHCVGSNMYMTPEDAARGLIIFDDVVEMGGPWDDVGGSDNYTDLSKLKFFRECVV